MFLWILLSLGLLLAYANGSNDNAKGVATLQGSGTASYRGALVWATVCTALGSLAALTLARGLLAAFSGKGLVPAEIAAQPAFPGAVALAAGCTVLAATRLGLPISTTHAVLGGLVGAALWSAPQEIAGGRLAQAFGLPLLTSPFLALALTAATYPLLRRTRRRLDISRETCICIGERVVGVVPGQPGAAQALAALPLPELAVGEEATCRVRYRGRVLGLSAGALVDAVHYLSSGAVSFARGLNDTPKIAALMLAGGALAPDYAIAGVAAAMALGGLAHARRVAHTLAHRVTEMSPGQGLAANAVTSLLVIGASHLGFPVSTTHVSCGALFGIGAVNGRAHWHTVRLILAAWVTTLPLAMLLGALFAAGLAQLG